MDYLFLGVGRFGDTMQKHRHSSDVLASLSELRGVVPPVQDVVLDLTGVTPGAAHQVTCVRCSVLRRACRRRWQLVLPPLL